MTASPGDRKAMAPAVSVDSTPAAGELERLELLSSAVESGAGLPTVARAASAALNVSLAVLDQSSAVIAVAAASPEDEKRLLTSGSGVEDVELKVAGSPVGLLKMRWRDEPSSSALLRMATMMIALEVERSLAPERADQFAAGELIGDLITRRDLTAGDLLARASEAGVELKSGGAFILVRATPRQPTAEDWRARMLLIVERIARSVHASAIAARLERQGAVHGAEVFVLLPAATAEIVTKAAEELAIELQASLANFSTTIGYGRPGAGPLDLFRASQEALLAANVAGASASHPVVSFEDTGAYRLLLPAMSDDPQELKRFYEETIEPLVNYDEQYETELLLTVETFLEADANVAGTAQRLFTHRHTVRYRLERVRDLTGLDCSSTDGREKISLGLKAMRVLGIATPHGPATERGVEGGRVNNEPERP